MANKKFWFGMLVMVLVFGMTAVGCDNGTGGGNDSASNPFIGTWTGTIEGELFRLVITGNSWTASYPNNPGLGSFSGTYTRSGNTATFISTDGSSVGGTGTISGNTMYFTGGHGESGTLTRS